jgi:hypothetical protein
VVDITPVFTAYFARNRGPVLGNPEGRQAPDYGVSARLDNAVVDLSMTFRSGSAYCCYEPGCHLNLYDGKRWGWLRRDLSALGIAPALPLELRLTVVVEAGAHFFDFSRPDSSRRGWYVFAPEAGLGFEKVLAECVEQDGEQNVAPDCGGIM